MTPRWRIAVHEAGHAVAHVALGGHVAQVSIRRARDTAGRCRTVDQLPPWETALVRLAGPCAELFTAAEPTDDHLDAVAWSGGADDDHDHPTAERLALEHGFSLGDTAETAAELVLEHWAAIEAVARALRGSKRGIVSGDRVAEIVRTRPIRQPAPTRP